MGLGDDPDLGGVSLTNESLVLNGGGVDNFAEMVHRQANVWSGSPTAGCNSTATVAPNATYLVEATVTLTAPPFKESRESCAGFPARWACRRRP